MYQLGGDQVLNLSISIYLFDLFAFTLFFDSWTGNWTGNCSGMSIKNEMNV